MTSLMMNDEVEEMKSIVLDFMALSVSRRVHRSQADTFDQSFHYNMTDDLEGYDLENVNDVCTQGCASLLKASCLRTALKLTNQKCR